MHTLCGQRIFVQNSLVKILFIARISLEFLKHHRLMYSSNSQTGVCTAVILQLPGSMWKAQLINLTKVKSAKHIYLRICVQYENGMMQLIFFFYHKQQTASQCAAIECVLKLVSKQAKKRKGNLMNKQLKCHLKVLNTQLKCYFKVMNKQLK